MLSYCFEKLLSRPNRNYLKSLDVVIEPTVKSFVNGMHAAIFFLFFSLSFSSLLKRLVLKNFQRGLRSGWHLFKHQSRSTPQLRVRPSNHAQPLERLHLPPHTPPSEKEGGKGNAQETLTCGRSAVSHSNEQHVFLPSLLKREEVSLETIFLGNKVTVHT